MRLLLLAVSLLFPFTALARETSFIGKTANGVELRNDHVSVVFSTSGELISCKELSTGVEYAKSGKQKIARTVTKAGKTIEADNLALSGTKMAISFGRNKIVLEVRAEKDYFTFEVVGGTFPELEKVTFIDLKFKYDFAAPNAFVTVGVAMTLQTNPGLFPSGEDKEVIGICTAHTGMVGAKLAFVACRKAQLREVLKSVYSGIPAGAVPKSLAGGAFAQDYGLNGNDCLLTRGFSPSEVQTYIDVYGRLGIRQFDFEIGPKTFVQGDFSFPGTGSASNFKEQVTAPLLEAGIVSTLHTFSFYIGYDATEILSNSKWQQQLEVIDTYTLAKTMTASATTAELRGGKKKLANNSEYWSDCSPFMLIDQEIVRYTVGNNSLLTCKRGQCGTQPAPHKSGSTVKVIGGHYSHIAPQVGSELFYEVARRTAKAYNEGGFKGLYFDALDGLSIHLKNAGLGDYQWYYGAAFINEVLKNCDGEPLVEYSILYPSIWSARGRGGAWDTPNRGYKNYIDDHIKSNLTMQSRHYVTTLGWFNFYPLQKNQPGNFSTKYMFTDDVDYLGSRSVAYNQPIVYNSLNISDINSVPGLHRNLEVFNQYSKLRAGNYFSDDVRRALRNGAYEYKLARKGSRWGFYEMAYSREELHDIKDTRLVSYNPFKRQKPFIRLEGMYTSDCKTGISLMKYDEKVDVAKQKRLQTFPNAKDLSNCMAIKVTVKGNGAASKDALCIRLQSAGTTGYADYVVRTNFEGWRDVILANLDNGEYGDLNFEGMEDDNYKTHRYSVNYSSVQSIGLFLSGNCAGVKVKEITAVPLVTNTVTNPSVSLGKASLVFKDALASGEYLEYQVGDRTAIIYDSIGNARSVSVEQKGRFRIPSGHYGATVSGITELSDAPAQVVLTIGVKGKFFGN